VIIPSFGSPTLVPGT